MNRLLNDEEIREILLDVADHYYDAETDVTVSHTVIAQVQRDLTNKDWVGWLQERAMWSDDGEQAVIVISKEDWQARKKEQPI